MWQGDDCEAIFRLMSISPGHLFSCKEISRTLDRQRFKEDSLWARQDLKKLVEHGRIKQDNSGFFFVPQEGV
jgi:hypothetical protein